MDTILKKAELDQLAADIKAHRTIETWGTALFLSAIILYCRQIIEWRIADPTLFGTYIPNNHHIIPAFIGMFGYAFLLVNNRYGRTARWRFHQEQPGSYKRRGPLGWLFAAMPLLTGFSASTYLDVNRELVSARVVYFVTAVGVAFFASYYDVYRKPKSKKHESTS